MLSMIKAWKSFQSNTALWVGAASIIFGFISSIGVAYAISTYYSSVKTNELLNRPYIDLNVPWFVFFNEDGSQYEVGQNPELSDIAHFKIANKTTNFGKLPAERIKFTATSTPRVFEFTDTQKVTIYDELEGVSQVFSADILEDLFKDNSRFAVRLELEYRLPGSDKTYIAFSESACVTTLLGKSLSVKCYLIKQGTN